MTVLRQAKAAVADPRASFAEASPRAEAFDPERFRPVAWLPTTPWSFLWHFVRSYYWPRYLAMVGAAALGQGVETFDPYILKLLVNGVTADAKLGALSQHTVFWFVLLVAVWFAGSLCFRLYQIIDISTGPAMRERVQNEMFGYLLGHSPRYFQENFAGKLGQKIKESGRACLSLLEMITFDMVRIAVMLAVAVVLLSSQESFFALLLCGWTAVYILFSVLLAYRCVRLSKAMSDAVSTSSGKLIDAISNADSIRSFAKWRFERWFLGGYLKEERRRSVKLRWFLTYMRLFQAAAMLSMLALFTWMALQRTAAGAMDIGTFTMVFALINLISMQVWNLSNRMLDFFDQMGTLTEGIMLVTAPHEIVDRQGAQPLSVTRGGIRFDDVTYAHPDGTVLFDRLNLDIAPGEKVALVGPSGGGKTTLVRLLRRQFEPQSGRVLIDGQDIADATWDSVNEAVAEVSQTVGIFHRPIGENIRYGQLEAADLEVVEAAIQAHCHEFIARRPHGYRTIVGEQGIKLSGGERQRVAIARAMLKRAKILVLDEATSALDSESEHIIQQALWRVMQGRTVIAIAHRLSTVTGMDRILYLESGRILEEGSHADLVARGGAYAKLWSRQVGGFLSDEAA